MAIEARSSKTLWIALVAIEAPLNNTAYMNMNCCAFVHTLEWHYLSCIYAICICICTCERVRAIDQATIRAAKTEACDGAILIPSLAEHVRITVWEHPDGFAAQHLTLIG